MQGKVIAVEDVRITVLVADGLAILELIGRHATEIGDVLAGDLATLGVARIRNETKQIEFDAFVEDCTWPADDFTAAYVDIDD